MYSNATMDHADITLPKPDVHASHPFRDADNHDCLLTYLKQRLLRGKTVRDSKLERMTVIDRDVNAFMRLSEDDRERVREEKKAGIPQATMVHLPLTFVHIDDMMTYLVQTFAPSRGMFYQHGTPEDTSAAQQIVTLMNNHAIYGGYFREVARVCWSILKYRQAGIHGYWSKDFGPTLSADTSGQTVVNQTVVWQGNRCEAIDPYNDLSDPSVPAIDLHRDGEWAASAKVRSHYWLKNKCAQGLYFNCDDLLSQDTGFNAQYYVNPPNYARMENQTGGTNWIAVLSEQDSFWSGSGFEIVEGYYKLNPMQFGLLPNTPANRKSRSRYEIWRFTICNDTQIIDATYCPNIHGHLPYYYGSVRDDQLGSANKSPAEVIAPLGKFGSFLMNSHIQTWRKNTYGFTFYDPTGIDMGAVPKGEVAAHIPLKAAGYGKDIRTLIYKDQSTANNDGTMESLESVMGLIEKFFPTQSMPSQIASIDRAVDSQVAAVQQGSNRRMQKDARMIDDTLFRPFRFCCYYNIIQFQADGEDITDFRGKPVTVNLQELRQTDLPFIIGMGLKSIDIQSAAARLQQIIFALIQNPQAASQIDLLGLIDYWTSLIDIDVDMTKFHLQQQQGAVGPDGRPIAGAPVTPITNPQALTGALTKPGVSAPAG